MNPEKFPYHSPDTVFTENALDNQLFHEFLKEAIDKQKIKELIAQGLYIGKNVQVPLFDPIRGRR